jgi:hypothetical protein
VAFHDVGDLVEGFPHLGEDLARFGGEADLDEDQDALPRLWGFTRAW